MSYDEPRLLAVPAPVWQSIANILEQAGEDQIMIAGLAGGGNVVMINMEGIDLIPASDGPDMLIYSGRLSDLLVQSNEETFRAGWDACEQHHKGPSASGPPDNWPEAWGHYTPSDAILELEDHLTKGF